MAIYHLSMKPIARGSGRSAVAAAAYRSGERLVNERDGLVHDFTRKGGIEHKEIVLPDGADAEWAKERSALWNAAEFAERRKDARVAREFEIALPHELTAEERLELTRDFARGIADRYKVAVDFAIHSPDDDNTDVRNHHAHVMITTREVTEAGLGDKTIMERENRWLVDNNLPTSHQQLKTLRLEWEELSNLHLARAGHDIHIDHRSHQERGLSLEPTQHVGVHATQMDKRGLNVERQRLEAEAARRNAARIRQDPAVVFDMITSEKSVFDKRDMARTLHRYINDDPQEFHALLTRIMASDQLVQLAEPNAQTSAKYSTREMVDLETGMIHSAMRMNETGSHVTDRSYVDAAISEQNRALIRAKLTDMKAEIQAKGLTKEQVTERIKGVGLSAEQAYAIRYVTVGRQVSAVVGYAGAGKSTMLTAAREAWEAQGYTVHGAALAGKAAEGLEESSGITSRTLASWEHGWKKGRDRLTTKDVFVIDEAGMIGSRQMAKFVDEARQSGAKLVLVGDHEQLQAIGAGAAFRSIVEHVGCAELQEVRRQRQDWQREASILFASHRTSEALEAYIRHEAVTMTDTQDAARQKLVRDYVRDVIDNPNASRLAMAHSRADVRQLNSQIRLALQQSGRLSAGEPEMGGSSGFEIEHDYKTNDGARVFVKGDRLVFLENSRELGVKNGVLGTVERTEVGRLWVNLDGRKGSVMIDASKYRAFDHGYATTIHKTQGATVDRSFVLASQSMDRHLAYVSMTRHREALNVIASREHFNTVEAMRATLSRSTRKEVVLDYTISERGIPYPSGRAKPHERAVAFRRDRGLER
ncbi:MAG: Ti-type conjugative transfer relaxase TraA [Asticcacaulis sp.]|uniref:Ti-type conjugative transfer relaxase TraA n=1 Tax=Asticcacaulis sp. TaxID=1872648 RepID=UPI0039E28F38